MHTAVCVVNKKKHIALCENAFYGVPMTTTVDQLKEQVRAAIRSGQTPGSLARQANLHRNSLYGWDREDWNPTANTLAALEPIVSSRA